MQDAPTWAIGVVLAGGIAVLARRLGALSTSGGVAAAVMGTLAMGAGWDWGLVLIAYFVAASALSRFRARDKARRTEGRIEKSGARDAAQVAANGGAFALAAMLFWLSPRPLWQAVGAAALAASSADTWATEIGTLARSAPRSILNGRLVPVGTSGGLTGLGLAAGLAGAGFVGVSVFVLGWPAAAVVAAILGGFFGCVLDSLLGATLQARRWCPACHADTERRVHHCGNATELRGGAAWLDNDGVNALSTLGGAVLGALAAYIVSA